jgi:hypothetical protein
MFVPVRVFIFTLLLALVGCVDEATVNTEAEFGKRLVSDLQARSFEAIEAQLDRTAVGDGARAALVKMADALPTDAPTSIDVAGLHVHTVAWAGKGTTRHVFVLLQYRFGDKWFLFDARWRKPDAGPLLVEGLHITSLKASLQEINRFGLDGKSAAHYAVLALAVALPVFTLVVLVLCVRTPMRRWRKAFWIVAILLGVTTLSLNWTTGALAWQPLRFQAGSAGFWKTPLGPAILQISFPLGAIVFLFRRRSLRRPVAGDGVHAATG